MFEIWGTYSTENTTRGDCRLESGSCSVCSLYLSVILCASVRASPCLRKHGYANLCACAPIMNHLYGRGKSNIACSSKSYNPAILFFSSRQGCIVYTPSQGHDSWEITQIFAQLSSYLLLIYKQSPTAFPCTTDAAQMCNPIFFFVLLLLLVDIKMHRRHTVNHQTLFPWKTASFPYELQSEEDASRKAWWCTWSRNTVASAELTKEIVYMFFFLFFFLCVCVFSVPWFSYGAFLMSGNLMGSSVIPQIHQILLVLLQRPRTAPRQKHDVLCRLVTFCTLFSVRR